MIGTTAQGSVLLDYMLSKAAASGIVPLFAAYVLMRVMYNKCLMLEGDSGYQMSFSAGLSCSWSDYFSLSTVMVIRLFGFSACHEIRPLRCERRCGYGRFQMRHTLTRVVPKG